MKATLVQRHDDRAIVRLTPSWLARVFGARAVLCELERRPVLYGPPQSRWYAAGTGREVDSLPYGVLIRDALDFTPVATPPIATARST